MIFKIILAVILFIALITLMHNVIVGVRNNDDKLKSGEIKGEGIQVIEYDELHKRSSEVLQYPNNHYPDGIQPISIYDGKYSITWRKAVERKNRELRHIAYCDFLNYVEIRGWNIKNEDWYYIDNLDASGLRHLLEKNRGRNDLYIPNRRRY